MQKELKYLGKFASVIAIIIITFQSCKAKVTTVLRDNPTFRITNDSLGKSLKRIIFAQEFNLDGTRTMVNNEFNSSNLLINVYDPSPYPEESLRYEKGLQIVRVIKAHLATPQNYTTFQVSFIQREIGNLKSIYWTENYNSQAITPAN